MLLGDGTGAFAAAPGSPIAAGAGIESLIVGDANGNYGAAYTGWGRLPVGDRTPGHLDDSAAFRFAA